MSDNAGLSDIDLRTLIAAVVDEHSDWGHRCHCGHQGGYPDHLADAVIRELGLIRDPFSTSSFHRYVTEWKPGR